MRFIIVDDDQSTSIMLNKIIMDYNLGEVIGNAYYNTIIDNFLFKFKSADILIVNLSDPISDRLKRICDLASFFHEKIIIVSQIADKDTIAKAYSFGVEYYITKPINNLELVGAIQKVIKLVQLQKCINDIKNILNPLNLKN